MKKEATLSFAIGYMFIFLIIVIVSIAAVPFLTQANSSFFESGNFILELGEDYADQIENESVRDTMQTIFSDTQDQFDNGEPALDGFVQYFWIFLVLVSAFVIIVWAKRYEVASGGVV